MFYLYVVPFSWTTAKELSDIITIITLHPFGESHPSRTTILVSDPKTEPTHVFSSCIGEWMLLN